MSRRLLIALIAVALTSASLAVEARPLHGKAKMGRHHRGHSYLFLRNGRPYYGHDWRRPGRGPRHVPGLMY